MQNSNKDNHCRLDRGVNVLMGTFDKKSKASSKYINALYLLSVICYPSVCLIHKGCSVFAESIGE